MTNCCKVDANVGNDAFSQLLVQFVVSRMSECSQEQFHDYYVQARVNGMTDREATEHGLVMAAFNEMVIATLRADLAIKGSPTS